MSETMPHAPFPWFGAKSRVADIIWSAFGRVKCYVEPFAGSLGVLLGRPGSTWWTQDRPGIETVNDTDAFVCCFWRAVMADADAVTRYVDWPVNEVDLLARHRWLRTRAIDLRERLELDPEYFDAQVAGWWAWGLSSWIGDGWCSSTGDTSRKLPRLSGSGCGVHGLGDVASNIRSIATRMRRVRVACGDWTRVMVPTVIGDDAPTGVFLDPPYGTGVVQYSGCTISSDVASAVRAWAIENGKRPNIRIALCAYDDDAEGKQMPSDWRTVAWTSRKGWNSDDKNRHRERIFLSPACLDINAPQMRLF